MVAKNYSLLGLKSQDASQTESSSRPCLPPLEWLARALSGLDWVRAPPCSMFHSLIARSTYQSVQPTSQKLERSVRSRALDGSSLSHLR